MKTALFAAAISLTSLAGTMAAGFDGDGVANDHALERPKKQMPDLQGDAIGGASIGHRRSLAQSSPISSESYAASDACRAPLHQVRV